MNKNRLWATTKSYLVWSFNLRHLNEVMKLSQSSGRRTFKAKINICKGPEVGLCSTCSKMLEGQCGMRKRTEGRLLS